jgi:hypothetical protein
MVIKGSREINEIDGDLAKGSEEKRRLLSMEAHRKESTF